MKGRRGRLIVLTLVSVMFMLVAAHAAGNSRQSTKLAAGSASRAEDSSDIVALERKSQPKKMSKAELQRQFDKQCELIKVLTNEKLDALQRAADADRRAEGLLLSHKEHLATIEAQQRQIDIYRQREAILAASLAGANRDVRLLLEQNTEFGKALKAFVPTIK